jgi:hypothetical protein
MSDNTAFTLIAFSLAAMIAVGFVSFNWRAVEIAKIQAEVDKVKAEEGKKYKFGTTKDE